MQACILRDKFSKAASLEIKPASAAGAAGPAWELFSGSSPAAIDYSASLLSGRGPGLFSIPSRRPGPARREYYALRVCGSVCGSACGGEIILAETRLPMRGGYNFRDLGGICAQDGRSVAWGRVFRADGLDGLAEDDLEYLASIPLGTVLDFRTERERGRAPDRLPGGVRRYLHWPIFPGSLSNDDFAAVQTLEESAAVMCRMYELFVTEEPILEHYRNFFRLLEDGSDLPLLFHCSAGKDRTGLAAALFLLALGVDRAAVMRDYLLSAEFLEGKYPPRNDYFFSVRPEFLQAALNEMERRSGSVENFLARVLGAHLENLRARYLAVQG